MGDRLVDSEAYERQLAVNRLASLKPHFGGANQSFRSVGAALDLQYRQVVAKYLPDPSDVARIIAGDVKPEEWRAEPGRPLYHWQVGDACVKSRFATHPPHSAKEDQISTVIAKKSAATKQLAEHLGASARIDRWLWVASGPVYFANTERARVRLDQNGIQFVGKVVLPKHLPTARPSNKR